MTTDFPIHLHGKINSVNLTRANRNKKDLTTERTESTEKTFKNLCDPGVLFGEIFLHKKQEFHS